MMKAEDKWYDHITDAGFRYVSGVSRKDNPPPQEIPGSLDIDVFLILVREASL